MNKTDKLIVHIASYSAIITGVVYGVLKYFFKVQSPYGEMPNEFQSTFLHLHVFLVPLFVFGFGLIWKCHIYPKWLNKDSKKRSTGVLLLFMGVLLIVSGYLIQTELRLKNVWTWSHIVISVAWIPFYLYHHFVKVAK